MRNWYSVLVTLLMVGMELLAPPSATALQVGHLPLAYLPASPDGHERGNANTPTAQAELQLLAARLLVDPVNPFGGAWPWKRQIINASAHGAIADDGEDDATALKVTITEACATSSSLFAAYLAKITTDPTLPRLPAGPDDRPFLVEVRFDPGQYDFVAGWCFCFPGWIVISPCTWLGGTLLWEFTGSYFF